MALTNLRNAIITGYFPAGKRLVERVLCEELGVSRTVVREAIRYLEAEGLVETLANKGPIVSVLNWHVAQQIYDIRLLLEQSAVADCTQKLDDTHSQTLRAHLQKLHDAFEDGKMQDLLSVSRELYRFIFEVANHDIAWEVVERLNGRISRLRAMTINSPHRAVTGYQRICTIVEAILEKDVRAAKAAVAAHLHEASSIAQHILESQSQDA
ncbi:GntR family transcriptional regulator [Acinetobacter sp. MD2(2019)]|nr:GntR family transcriptional regulator [Acinetobacter sp. MD2(2019)]